MQHAVRRREAHAGAGRPLIPDRPVGAAQIHLGAGRGIGHHAGLHGVRERPVHLHAGRRIADLGNQIADVRKELNTQTRWILAVMVGATVLIPVMQRVMAALFP